MKHPQGLHKAIKYYGTHEEFARILGVSRQIVGYWLNGERTLPEFIASQIFTLSKGTIPLDELSPLNHKKIYDLSESVVFYTKNPAIQLPIKEIKSANTLCPIYKENENLLSSLSNTDLSKPILIDANYQLITCECRLRGNLLLGRRYIHAYQLDLTDAISGDYPLKKFIHSLPISEKVAIGLAIEKELGNRRGKRTDLSSLNNYSENNSSRKCNRKTTLELRDKYPQVTPGTKSRELAAKIAGFNSDYAYRQAKIVNEKGLPALILAMDNNLCPISKAGQIASLSFEEQNLFLISNSKSSTTERET